jgi:hypothetical protein
MIAIINNLKKDVFYRENKMQNMIYYTKYWFQNITYYLLIFNFILIITFLSLRYRILRMTSL